MRDRQDPSWFLLGMLLVFLLAGCGANRWSPTDPRVADPDTSHIRIDARLLIPIGTTLTAAVLPVLFQEK